MEAAQIPGEIRDVSANILVALQYFVPQCVLFATFPSLSALNGSRFFQPNTDALTMAIILLSKRREFSIEDICSDSLC
jgi:hypothetical protein